MASGRQLAAQNVEAFDAWGARKTDDEFRAMVSRGVLSRKAIAAECNFAKSVLDQNPRVKDALRKLEDDLRKRKVLPPLPPESTSTEASAASIETPVRETFNPSEGRLHRLQVENASLKAELTEVKRALERYAVLSEALATTGRLPR